MSSAEGFGYSPQPHSSNENLKDADEAGKGKKQDIKALENANALSKESKDKKSKSSSGESSP